MRKPTLFACSLLVLSGVLASLYVFSVMRTGAIDLGSGHYVFFGAGCIGVGRGGPYVRLYWELLQEESLPLSRRLGWIHWAFHPRNAGDFLYYVPVWPALLAATGMLAAAPIRRMHRRSAGKCVTCGYQLATTTDRPSTIVCPECGLRQR